VAVNAGEGISVGAGVGEAAVGVEMGSKVAMGVGEALVAGPGNGVGGGVAGAVREAAEYSGLRLQVKCS